MKCFFKESIWRNDNKEMFFSFPPSLTIAFYLRKTENRTKKFLTQLSHYGFEQKYYFWKKMLTFLQKNADISKIGRGLVLKGKSSETAYRCIFTYQISSF